MNDFIDKLKSTANLVKDKSLDMAEIAKLNVDIASIKNQIREVHLQAGTYAMKAGLMKEDPTMSSFYSQLSAYEKQLSDAENKIRLLNQATDGGTQ